MRTRLRYVVLAGFALSLALAACGGASTEQDAAPTGNPSQQESLPTLTAAPTEEAGESQGQNLPSGDDQEDLIRAFDRLGSAYPFRLTETSTIAGCGDQTRVTEYASEAEFHTVWSGCSMNSEVIATANQWFYFVNGAWTSTSEFPAASADAPVLADLIREGLQSVTLSGNEDLHGDNSYVYDVVLALNAETLVNGTVWVGAADGLPHQSHALYNMSGIDIDTITVYDNFGIPVIIQPSIP